MAINDNSQVNYESGQTPVVWEQMTTLDDIHYSSSFAPWSGRSGFAATVAPFGILSGGTITPELTDDSVSVASLNANMPGTTPANQDGQVTLSSSSGVAVTRPAAGQTNINSVTVDNTGTIVVIVGTDGVTVVETRGTAGGPPFIPVDSVEVGQVRLNSDASAPVQQTEIYQVPGLHTERADLPIFSVSESQGTVTFSTPLPAIHTGSLPKQVWVTGYTPIFAEQPRCSDWVPAETTNSTNSTEVYDGVIGSTSSTINQATFTTRFNNGITDSLAQLKNERLWIQFVQDRNQSPYQLTLGKIGVSRSFPVNDWVQADITVSAETPTEDFEA